MEILSFTPWNLKGSVSGLIFNYFYSFSRSTISVCPTSQNHRVCTMMGQSGKCPETVQWSAGCQCYPHRYLWEETVDKTKSERSSSWVNDVCKGHLNPLCQWWQCWKPYLELQWPEGKCHAPFSLWSGTRMYHHHRSWWAEGRIHSPTLASHAHRIWWIQSALEPLEREWGII